MKLIVISDYRKLKLNLDVDRSDQYMDSYCMKIAAKIAKWEKNVNMHAE